MKIYTQAEFDAIPMDKYGVKHCPTGDYTQVHDFGSNSSFGECSSFGEHSSFGECCIFGEHSSFGSNSSFGECSFFGEHSSFGECCIFGVNCSHEGLTNSRYFACDRIGSERRKTYFFAAEEGLYVRAGCFFGTLDDFVERVKEVHAGTRYEREYLAAVELAKIVLEEGEIR